MDSSYVVSPVSPTLTSHLSMILSSPHPWFQLLLQHSGIVIDEVSDGCKMLIREGGHVVECLKRIVSQRAKEVEKHRQSKLLKSGIILSCDRAMTYLKDDIHSMNVNVTTVFHCRNTVTEKEYYRVHVCVHTLSPLPLSIIMLLMSYAIKCEDGIIMDDTVLSSYISPLSAAELSAQSSLLQFMINQAEYDQRVLEQQSLSVSNPLSSSQEYTAKEHCLLPYSLLLLLSPSLLAHILTYLPADSFITCSHVCTLFYAVLQTNEAWYWNSSSSSPFSSSTHYIRFSSSITSSLLHRILSSPLYSDVGILDLRCINWSNTNGSREICDSSLVHALSHCQHLHTLKLSFSQLKSLYILGLSKLFSSLVNELRVLVFGQPDDMDMIYTDDDMHQLTLIIQCLSILKNLTHLVWHLPLLPPHILPQLHQLLHVEYYCTCSVLQFIQSINTLPNLPSLQHVHWEKQRMDTEKLSVAPESLSPSSSTTTPVDTLTRLNEEFRHFAPTATSVTYFSFSDIQQLTPVIVSTICQLSSLQTLHLHCPFSDPVRVIETIVLHHPSSLTSLSLTISWSYHPSFFEHLGRCLFIRDLCLINDEDQATLSNRIDTNTHGQSDGGSRGCLPLKWLPTLFTTLHSLSLRGFTIHPALFQSCVSSCSALSSLTLHSISGIDTSTIQATIIALNTHLQSLEVVDSESIEFQDSVVEALLQCTLLNYFNYYQPHPLCTLRCTPRIDTTLSSSSLVFYPHYYDSSASRTPCLNYHDNTIQQLQAFKMSWYANKRNSSSPLSAHFNDSHLDVYNGSFQINIPTTTAASTYVIAHQHQYDD